MIKSELVQRISEQYPRLYRRDAERILNAILGQIVDALARREMHKRLNPGSGNSA
jgi:nucleoid DNA-binding protein